MALGERGGWDKSESRYCGVETEFEDDVPRLLSFNLSSAGFDFVVAPLMDPTYRPSLMEVDNDSSHVLPFAGSDLVLSPSQWSSHVVGKISPWIDLDSEDEILRMDSETTLKQEIAWATHLSLQACLLPSPKGASCANYARCVNQIVQGLSNMQLWLRIPLLKTDDDSLGVDSDNLMDSWELWNSFRLICEHHNQLSLALDILSTLPSVNSIGRWFGEPVRAAIIHTDVKKLEELGIGRPSTYASTLKVLQDRNYVTVKNRVLYPEFRGRMVSAFLSHQFSEVTEYSFTADMETELDNVSAGLTEWKGLLRDYWTRFSSYCSRAESVHIHQVEKMLEKTFGDFLFASLPNKNRMCPSCMEGTLIFKVSRFGAGYFIGCNQHPKCKYIAKTLYGDEEEEESPQKSNSVEEPKLLGLNPGSNEKVFLKNGPYGYYVQLGEDRTGYLPKRSSVSHIKNVDSITFEDALELLRYPITLGEHPKDGHPVILKLAKVGFSVRHRRTTASVPKSVKPKDVTLEKALELLSSKDVRRSGRPRNKPKVEEAM